METLLSDRVNFLLLALTVWLVARIYNLTRFTRFHKAKIGNTCKVDHQALSYVKVLSETHLFLNISWLNMEWISPLAHLLTKIYSIGVRTPVRTPGKSTTDLQGMYIYGADR